MAINLGALFAPTAATKVTNYFLARSGLAYNAKIPALAHQFLNGTITGEGTSELTLLASEQAAGITDLGQFSAFYIDKLGAAYNYGFAVACISLVLSIAIFLASRPWWKHADYNAKQLAAKPADARAEKPQELTPQQTKERITALILVFAVVIFFWMSFHQNGLTMTYFARDYTANSVEGLNRIGFDVLNLAIILVGVYSLFSIFQSTKNRSRIISGIVFAAAAIGLVWRYGGMDAQIDILPQIFQQFNPFFVVALTPVSLAIFGALARRGKEPSAPRKIGIGMVIAALGFLVLAIGSLGLATPDELAGRGGVSDVLVSPNWLISTYLVLTFAELLLSPMGISFVSKVAPPKYKGAMMGGWFAATAVGNYLVSIIGYLWGGMELWMVWGILIGCCLLSAAFIFSVIKRLERVTN
jgi:POT family proton-dependent oligopeptide transporter